MFSRNFNLVFRLSPQRMGALTIPKNTKTTSVTEATDRDPAPYFFNEKVQELLKIITHPEPEIVFRKRLDGHKIVPPIYKFMTDEELEKARQEAEVQKWKLLQMPPVIKPRKAENRILSTDPALQGFSKAKYVFTDITYGVSNKNRVIVVREVDGVLRTADGEERNRLNQIYFPMPGREINVPKMFHGEYLEAVLNRQAYEFILDRACVQFDPDYPEYQKITQITYDRIDQEQHYDKLRSTRHYGPMVFYLIWNNRLDNLLYDNLAKEKCEDAVIAVQLYFLIHPSKKTKENEKEGVELIQYYINTAAVQKSKLSKALHRYVEVVALRKSLKEGIDIAHGKSSVNNKEIKT